MKKYLIFFIVAFILVFSVYVYLERTPNQGESYNKSVSENDTITYNFRGIANYDRLQKFLNNVDKSKIDRINLVRYTIEGDPIITQLYFNEKDIVIAIDSSKDKFGGQDKNKILYSSIKGGKQLKDDLIKYLKNYNFYN